MELFGKYLIGMAFREKWIKKCEGIMGLTEQLNDLKQQLGKDVPREILVEIGQFVAGLVQSGIEKTSCQAGDKVPFFALPDVAGKTVTSEDILAKGPMILSFYRGIWWPFCNLELRSLQRSLPEIKSQGAELVTISPQLPDNSLSTAEKLALDFEVLSDVGNKVSRDFGLVFKLTEKMQEIYKNFGIDLPTANGDQSFELPIPATYVVAQNGTIAFAFIDADYTNRLDPETIIAELKKL